MVKRLLWPLFVVESKIRSQPDCQSTHRSVTLEINVFIFDAAPKAFDKDVIKGTNSAIHADDNARALEYGCVDKTRKMRTLVALEYFERAMVAQRLLTAVDAWLGVHCRLYTHPSISWMDIDYRLLVEKFRLFQFNTTCADKFWPAVDFFFQKCLCLLRTSSNKLNALSG